MHRTARTVTTAYVVLTIWSVAMLASALMLTGPVNSIGASLDATPAFVMATTMALSLAAATLATGVAWRVSRHQPERPAATATRTETGPTAALSSIR